MVYSDHGWSELSKNGFVCCVTLSELGDIAPNVRRSKVPQSEISYFEPPAGRITNEKFDKKSWKSRYKMPEGFWNPHQSIRNPIPDRYSAAELFVTPTELWDTRFSFFFKNVLIFREFLSSSPSLAFNQSYHQNIFKISEFLKIIYLRAPLELEKVLRHYIDQELDSWSIGEGFRTLPAFWTLVSMIFYQIFHW